MNAINLKLIGSTRKAHGKDGFIKLVVEENYIPDLLASKFLFVDVNGSRVPFFIEKINERPDICIKLEDISDPQQASKFSSKSIYLHENDITSAIDSTDSLDSTGLLGFKVIDQEDEHKGMVINVIENPHQLLIEVETENNTFMVPVHQDLIIDLAQDIKTLKIFISEGLDAL